MPQFLEQVYFLPAKAIKNEVCIYIIYDWIYVVWRLQEVHLALFANIFCYCNSLIKLSGYFLLATA